MLFPISISAPSLLFTKSHKHTHLPFPEHLSTPIFQAQSLSLSLNGLFFPWFSFPPITSLTSLHLPKLFQVCFLVILVGEASCLQKTQTLLASSFRLNICFMLPSCLSPGVLKSVGSLSVLGDVDYPGCPNLSPSGPLPPPSKFRFSGPSSAPCGRCGR